ncbi:MAG: hypothetical protein KDJ37_05220 [Hyphomicrobiaceae bacterium]|nr:hypothetical protein [Hyphomicrobiaceae bacterium]
MSVVAGAAASLVALPFPALADDAASAGAATSATKPAVATPAEPPATMTAPPAQMTEPTTGSSGPNATGDPATPKASQPTVTAYTCATEAFGMDFNPFRRTIGSIAVTLEDPPPEPTGAGAATGSGGAAVASRPLRWRVAAIGGGHDASIAELLKKTCAASCPATRAEDGSLQLWAPAPKSVAELSDDEMLTLAVLRLDKLDIKISTFRGREIVALEKGTCRTAAAGQ